MSSVLGGFEELGLGIPRLRCRGPAARLHQRQRHPEGTALRHQQGLSLRRGTRPAGRRHGRRYQPLPPLRRLDGRQMGHVKNGGVDHAARHEFLETHHLGARYDCHTCWARPTCARADAITRHSSTTAIPPRPTCTTATGSADGTTCVCGSTARSASGIRSFWNASTKTDHKQRKEHTI